MLAFASNPFSRSSLPILDFTLTLYDQATPARIRPTATTTTEARGAEVRRWWLVGQADGQS